MLKKANKLMKARNSNPKPTLRMCDQTPSPTSAPTAAPSDAPTAAPSAAPSAAPEKKGDTKKKVDNKKKFISKRLAHIMHEAAELEEMMTE